MQDQHLHISLPNGEIDISKEDWENKYYGQQQWQLPLCQITLES